ncbi:uncharacterized protein LOC129595738 [Paramacrobiotus metropolitanus]|uniref:uncharacterized protein LOC129595738 n=1 Tax=Paramacrobiotus metropolitanus TaxID=2943436 RepID=UPI002445AE13|nr:uncharacterized protein LOC129595738 [Paramacrobiotus metropolitanus]
MDEPVKRRTQANGDEARKSLPRSSLSTAGTRKESMPRRSTVSRGAQKGSSRCRQNSMSPIPSSISTPPPTPKPEMVAASTDNPKLREPGFVTRLLSRIRQRRRVKQVKKKIDRVTKHKLDKAVLEELGNQVGIQVPSNAQLTTYVSEGVGPDEDDKSDSEQFTENDFRIRDFVNLLGVDPHVPHRTALELFTDRERLVAEKKLAVSSKTTNAAILQNLDFEKIEDYDEEFLLVWDLDAGEELIDYMDEQIEAYQCEYDQLCEENRTLKTQLLQLKRRKQDSYFRVKDLETIAAEAEKRYGRLHRTRPSKRQLDKLNTSRRKMVIVAALLDQREELFREHRRIHRELRMGNNAYRKEEYEANKEIKKTFRLLQESVKLYQKALKDEELRRKDLALIRQEMNYLSEEIGLYVFQDGNSHHSLQVAEALAYLSKNVQVPEEKANPVKRLSQMELSLSNLKATGFQYMKTVNDTHTEVLWHVNQREDILASLIREYMERKEILKIDPKVLKVMHVQRQNVPLIEMQLAEQTGIAADMEPRWLAIKDENARLRDIVVRLSVVSHSRRKSKQEIVEEEKLLRRQSLEQLCATINEASEFEEDEFAPLEPQCACKEEVVAIDTWGETTDTDQFCDMEGS